MHMCMSCHQKHPQSEEWGSMAIKVSVSQYGFAVLEFHRSKQPKHLQGLAINNVGQVKEDLSCETWGDMGRQQKPAYICKPNVRLTWIIIIYYPPYRTNAATSGNCVLALMRKAPRKFTEDCRKRNTEERMRAGRGKEWTKYWLGGSLKMDGSKGLGRRIGQEGNRTERQRKMRWQGWDGWTSGEWIGRCMAQAIFLK